MCGVCNDDGALGGMTIMGVQVAEVEAPLDRDLYQADKGLKNTEFVIRDGGVILLDAGCNSGVVRSVSTSSSAYFPPSSTMTIVTTTMLALIVSRCKICGGRWLRLRVHRASPTLSS